MEPETDRSFSVIGGLENEGLSRCNPINGDIDFIGLRLSCPPLFIQWSQ